MKLTISIICIVAFVLLGGCAQEETDPKSPRPHSWWRPTPVGTTRLLFPEWEHSDSAFERAVYTNYYVVRCEDGWHTREMQPDGSLKPFWKSDRLNESIKDAKLDFAWNISWHIHQSMYDGLVEAQTEVPK